MDIKNEQPERRYNNDFLSHRCPLDGSVNTRDRAKLSSSRKDQVIKTAEGYQCHKFHFVCMVMGIPVLVESENGTVSRCELVPKDYIQHAGRHSQNFLNKIVVKSAFSSSVKFNISTQAFKRDSRSN
ncbi:MAG: hypothetical protein AAGG81_08410 [Chlamydiota bacterium]